MGHELRRSYLVKRSFQLKLILRLSLMILATSLMVALIFIGSRYYLTAIVEHKPQQFRMLDELGSIFFEVLIWWLLGYLVLFAYFALRFSNEIAGPLYRLEKALRAIADKGDLRSEVHLRDDDDPEFHHLAALFNRALGRVRSAVQGARGALDELKGIESAHEPGEMKRSASHARQSLETALGSFGELPAPLTGDFGAQGADERQQRLPAAVPEAEGK